VNTDSGPAFTYRADNGLHFCQDDAFPVEYDRYPGMTFAMWCGDLWRGEPGHTWRRAQHMPAWASRITLEVESVRVCRIWEISEDEAEAMCFYRQEPECYHTNCDDRYWATGAFAAAWTSRYGRRYPWESNPWVWAAKVKRVEG